MAVVLSLHISITPKLRVLCTGADLGSSERGANHNSGSLKQGSGGHRPPEAIGYFVL